MGVEGNALGCAISLEKAALEKSTCSLVIIHDSDRQFELKPFARLFFKD
jgi:hypothetical protein